ncbi:hypothetical protein B2G50_14475 [Leptospira interrogans serovar Canicola]|nr:hypothetical protein B2G50_14475 [Leptospira interrogans serovar Canicola]
MGGDTFERRTTFEKKSPWVKRSDPPWIAESSETKKFVNLPGYDLIRSAKEAISKIKKNIFFSSLILSLSRR